MFKFVRIVKIGLGFATYFVDAVFQIFCILTPLYDIGRTDRHFWSWVREGYAFSMV